MREIPELVDEGHAAWHSKCGRYNVVITRTCFEEMTKLAREHLPEEAGTALAGSYSDDGFQATVASLAPYTVDSRGHRSRFHRGARGLATFFRDLFRSTRGLVHYVGEWHSHPGGRPFPSGVDDANALAIASDPSARCPECILVILAVTERAAECGVFVYSRREGRIQLWSGLRQDR